MTLPTPYYRSLERNGFSIIELMVVLAVAAILTMIAVPNFQVFLDRQRVVTTASDLYASVALARSEAIRRGARVNVVPIDGVHWNQGWEVVVSGTGGERLFRREPTASPPDVVQDFNPGSDVAMVSYDGTGRSTRPDNPQLTYIGDLTITGLVATGSGPSATKATRKLSINQVGRPFLCDPSVSTCP